jgi:hypothetical protein
VSCVVQGHTDRSTAYMIPRSTKFKTFPDLLVLHMKKFQLVNWMPTKLGKCTLTPFG